jgi:serine/threonine protein kinase
MICASCGESVQEHDTSCPSCGDVPVLAGRYLLLNVIGQGGAGVTFRARRLSDRALVCVKELAYNRLADFDAQKLFEREASVLRQLDHPGIPDFVDHFTAGEGKALSLYIVQEYVRGHTLEQEMDAYRYNELEVLGIMDEIAQILDYLEDLRPRVVHRDIKPANIIRRDRDNRLMLVDFGSVKATTQADGQTIVGTAGYMAPEQAWGTATPQSDFYSLGVLGVVLLSRREPHELLDANHRLDWVGHVDCAPATREILGHLLRANPEERPQSAEAVRRGIDRAVDQVKNGWAEPQPEPQSTQAPPQRALQDSRRGERVQGHQSAQSQSRRAAIIVLIVVFLVGVGAVLAVAFFSVSRVTSTTPSGATSTSAPTTAEPPPEPPQCPSGDCEPISVPFKEGLEFGMDRDAVAAQLEGMGEVRETDPRAVTHRTVSGASEHAVALPGARFVVETQTAGEPSECSFALAVDESLSAASCRLEPMSSLSGHRSAMNRIHSALEERYGNPTDDNFSTVVEGSVFNEKNNWSWSGDGTQLVLTSRFRRVSGEVQESVLSIEQMTNEHRSLVEDAQRRSLESFEERERELESEPL